MLPSAFTHWYISQQLRRGRPIINKTTTKLILAIIFPPIQRAGETRVTCASDSTRIVIIMLWLQRISQIYDKNVEIMWLLDKM